MPCCWPDPHINLVSLRLTVNKGIGEHRRDAQRSIMPRSQIRCCELTSRCELQEPAGRNRLRPLGPRTAAGSDGRQQPRRQRPEAPASPVAARQEPQKQHDSEAAASGPPPDAVSAQASGKAASPLYTTEDRGNSTCSAPFELSIDGQTEPEPSRPQPPHPASLPPVQTSPFPSFEVGGEQRSTLRCSAPAGTLSLPSRLSKRSSASGGSSSGSASVSDELSRRPGLMTRASPDALRRSGPDPDLMAAYRPHQLTTARSMPVEWDFMLTWSLPAH